MWRYFSNREEAGRVLARSLSAYKSVSNLLVLGLPRGGVPVAFEVARELGADLEVFTVRKLGVPGQTELAMGAVASGGIRVLNEDVIRMLRITPDVIDAVADREDQELQRREELYRHTHTPLTVRGKTVILVDDGIATGSTMRAAIKAIRQLGAGKLVVATPVAPADVVAGLKRVADQVVVLETPEPFYGVGQWYEDFSQVTDKEVHNLLRRAHEGESIPS